MLKCRVRTSQKCSAAQNESKKLASDLLLKRIGCNYVGGYFKLQCSLKKGTYSCSSLCDQCQINEFTDKYIISAKKDNPMDGFNFGMDMKYYQRHIN